MIVVWLFLAVPWTCLQFMIVVFPDHTHYIFTIESSVIAQQSHMVNADWIVKYSKHAYMCVMCIMSYM